DTKGAEAERASRRRSLSRGLSPPRSLRSAGHRQIRGCRPLISSGPEGGIGMSRALTMVFAIICYAIFFATFLYLIVFVGGFEFARKSVDSGTLVAPATAAIVDVLLIAVIGLQHSVMARQSFKRWWLRIVPPPIERSVYVLCASIALMILFTFWRPIDTIVWTVANPILHDIIWLLFWIGWGTVLLSTFLINHFELFGLQQAWFHMRRRDA